MSQQTRRKDLETAHQQAIFISPPYEDNKQEDGISLIDLWAELSEKKCFILGATIVSTIVAIVYALLAPPVYRSEITFLPPNDSDIQPLTIVNRTHITYLPQSSGDMQAVKIDKGQDINAASVYKTFKRNIISKSPRMKVFNRFKQGEISAANIAEERESILKNLDKGFSVKFTEKKERDGVQITELALEGRYPDLIYDVLNQIADEAVSMTKTELIRNIHSKVNMQIRGLQKDIELLREKATNQRLDKIKRLEAEDSHNRKIIQNKIKALRISARQKRLDRISMLKESAIIAESLGIRDFADRQSASDRRVLYMMDPFTDNLNVYVRGVKAIEAEIETLSNIKSEDPFFPALRDLQAELTILEQNPEIVLLKARKDDDPFIESLRDKQIEIKRLQMIDVDPAIVRVARMDQIVNPADNKIKPRPILIVILGFGIGLILGVSGVLFYRYIENERDFRNNQTAPQNMTTKHPSILQKVN